MISLPEGTGGGRSDMISSPKGLEKLVKAILEDDPYAEASRHDGLSLSHLSEIITFLMYVENNKCLQVIIEKESDGYHLSLTIDKKE